jgi:hypothetical protein
VSRGVVAACVSLLQLCGCAGGASTEGGDGGLDADQDTRADASVDSASDVRVDAVSDATPCPPERPISGSECPTLGLVCVKSCTAADPRAWTAECKQGMDRLVWSAWGNPCSDSEW